MKNFVKKYNVQIIVTIVSILFLELIFIFGARVYPFKSANILVSDLYFLYAPVFNYMREAILSGRSIFSSFSFTMGQSMVGILAYYCMSPLNLLLLFSNIDNITYFIKIILIIKFALCALNMSIYLNNKTSKLNNFIFSLVFAFTTYNIQYSFNVMWLDVIYILPLVILGLERIIEGKSPKLYICTLAFMIFSNFYLAFSGCIFIFIYFLYYSFINKKLNFKLFYKFAFFSIISVLLDAFLLCPTIFNMLDGKVINAVSGYDKAVLYNPLNAIYNLSPGATAGYVLNDLPYFYSSTLVLVLFINYLFNSDTSFREKWLSFGIVMFFILSTLFEPLDLLFHCFKVPNSLFYRYMYILPFFLISIVSRNKVKMSWFSLIPIILLSVWAVSIEFSFKMVIFVTLLFLYFFLIKVDLKYFVAVILIGELFYNSFVNIKVFNGYGWYDDVKQYGEKLEKYYPEENEFYRIEVDQPITVNDGFLLGYYNVNSFSPTTINTSKTFFKKYLLHAQVKGMNYIYQNRFILDPYFLGIKYELVGKETKEVKENEYYLPLIIKSDSFDYFKPTEFVIENSNNLYKMINGEYLFKEIDFELDCVKGENPIIDKCKLKYPRRKGYNYYLEIYDSADASFEGSYTEHNKILDVDENFEFDYYSRRSRKLKLYEYRKEDIKIQEENKFEIFNDNYMKLNIDKGRYLMTIPYDEGWHIRINGKEVEKIKVLDSLIGFEAENGTLEIEFVPRGLLLGTLISGATFMIIFVYYARKKLM